MVTYRNIYRYENKHIYCFVCQLRGPKTNGTPLVTSTPSALLLISNILQLNETEVLRKMAGFRSRTGTGNIQDELSACYSA